MEWSAGDRLSQGSAEQKGEQRRRSRRSDGRSQGMAEQTARRHGEDGQTAGARG